MDCNFCPWNSPGKNTGVGSHSLLQGSSQPRVWNWVSHDKSGFRNHFFSNSGDLKVTHILNQDCSCPRNRSTSSSWWWFPGQPLEKNHSFWHVFHSDSFESEVKSLSRVWLFATLWTVAHQAPLSMGFSRQNTGVGCHFLLQGNLPNPGIEPRSPTLQADALTSEGPGIRTDNS